MKNIKQKSKYNSLPIFHFHSLPMINRTINAAKVESEILVISLIDEWRTTPEDTRKTMRDKTETANIIIKLVWLLTEPKFGIPQTFIKKYVIAKEQATIPASMVKITQRGKCLILLNFSAKFAKNPIFLLLFSITLRRAIYNFLFYLYPRLLD